jgi:peptidoglycan hydrolase-like protein with peptidoglycan-binding domain
MGVHQMKRPLLAAFALVAGCMGHDRTAQSDRAAAPRTGDETAVARPSDFSPEQVRTLQRALSDRGFAVDLTGRFDDRTQTALMDFQRARGLPSTGNLNQPTVEALGIDPREVMPVRGESESHEASPAPRSGPATGPNGAEGPRSSDDRDAPAAPAAPNPTW